MEVSLGLTEGKLSSQWTSLSGGERQRAAIACALILARTVPDGEAVPVDGDHGTKGGEEGKTRRPGCVILFDEPTAACDADTCLLVERAIMECGAAVVMITHDDRQSVRVAHRRLRLTLRATSSRASEDK